MQAVPPDALDDDGPARPATHMETAEYARDMLVELARLADAARLRSLSVAIMAAHAVAEDQHRRLAADPGVVRTPIGRPGRGRT